MEKIILISGMARHGKDTVAEMLQKQLDKSVITPYADYLKFICEKYFGWNGVKDDDGREILQRIGTNVIRKENPDFWVNIVTELNYCLRSKWDYAIIPDCRFPNEYTVMVNKFGKNRVIAIKVDRPNFTNNLTQNQLKHSSENAMKEFEFDYIISNNGTIQDLQVEVNKFINIYIKPLSIYVAGAYSAPTEQGKLDNSYKAINAGIEIIKKKHIPFIPHLSHWLDAKATEQGISLDWNYWMYYTNVWLHKCDALLYLNSSKGADIELEVAKNNNKAIYYSVEEIPEFLGR